VQREQPVSDWIPRRRRDWRGAGDGLHTATRRSAPAVSTSTAEPDDRITRACEDVSARVTGAVDAIEANRQSVGDDVADVTADIAGHVEQFTMAARTGPLDRGFVTSRMR